MSTQNTTFPAKVQLEYHRYYPCHVSTPTLFPKSSQFIISPAHAQHNTSSANAQSVLVYHLSSPCPVMLSPLLPMTSLNAIFLLMSSQYAISSALIFSTYLSCSRSVSTPSLMSMSIQNTNSPTHIQLGQITALAHVQSVHHVFSPNLVSKPSDMAMSDQSATPPVCVQTLPHVYCPCKSP